MTEDLHIQAVVAEAEEGEVLGRINLSGGVITSLESAGELRTAIGATMPKKNFRRFKVWFQDYTKEPSSLSENGA
ncbi:MAG TPA: hypothetical protein VKY92_09515 [Verrucomicrobiae bacterium]|nr:hypothetical protein [Verrucomicrobiae bacterium]